jgi:hypothetical protein
VPTPQQLDLFDPVLPGCTRGALSSLAAIWEAIAATPALHTVAAAAALEARGRGGNRGTGEAYEEAFTELLTPTVQRAISAETLELLTVDAAPALQRLTGVTWVHLESGRAPADFLVTLVFADGGLLEVPVNLKRAVARDVVGDAVALRTLIRVARGERISSGEPVNVAREALRWWAGRSKIQTGDYVLLIVEGDPVAGTVTGIHAQGMLSAVAPDGTLAASRHPSREVALYRPARAVLPPGMDVNAAFAAAISPAADADDLRLALLVWMAAQRHWAPATTRRYARALDDATDTQLAAVALTALRTLAAGHRARSDPTGTV